MFEFDGIEYHIAQKVLLNNIYICVNNYEIVALIGNNGCGKSTLFQIIYGIKKAKIASLRTNKKVFKNAFKNIEFIHYLPQSHLLPDSLTLSKAFKLYNVCFADFKNTFPEIKLERDAPISLLSFGQKRLVEVYISVFRKCKLCILDEPFTFLMPLYIETIKQIILSKKQEKCFLISDHSYPHIKDISDRIYLLKDGKTWEIENESDLIFRGYLPNSWI